MLQPLLKLFYFMHYFYVVSRADHSPTCCSNVILDVSLWAERATSFPAKEIHSAGQDSPQVVIFVGTLVKSFSGMSLSGGPSCKWYINPDVPEAKKLMARYVFILLSLRLIYKFVFHLPPQTYCPLVSCTVQKKYTNQLPGLSLLVAPRRNKTPRR